MNLSFAQDVLETLRAIEWEGSSCGDGWNGPQCEFVCPFCGALKSSGVHVDDCRVARLIERAIAETQKEMAK